MLRITAAFGSLCTCSVDFGSNAPFTEEEAKFVASKLRVQVEAFREQQRFAHAVQDALNNMLDGGLATQVTVTSVKGETS